MAEAMTFNSLNVDLTNYLQRYDATIIAQIPRFIMLAQIAIPRDLKILGFRQEVIGSFDATTQNTGMMQKPSDWRKNIAFFVATGAPAYNTHTPVFLRAYEYVRAIFPDPTVQGTPRFYADADWNHWLVSPAPNPILAPYFKIPYYGTLVMLDDANQTNWLTTNSPDTLLYKCLLEAAAFVKTDERIPTWQTQYQIASAGLLKQEAKGMIDRQGSTTEN